MTTITLKIVRHALLAVAFVSTAAAAAPADHHAAVPPTAAERSVWVDAALVRPGMDRTHVMISNADGGN